MNLFIENTTPVSDRLAQADLAARAADRSLNHKLLDTTGARLLSRAEYCSLLGISSSTSERWDRTGYGPRPIKVGPRRLGYRLRDVLSFIEARRLGDAKAA